MADITYSSTTSWSHRVLTGIGSAFATFGRALAVSHGGEARLREVERLQAKTDGELANLGISRDRIVHHVFRDIYDV